MRRNLKQGILFILIVIGLPIMANLIAEILANIIKMDIIMKCVYFILVLSIIYLFKEAR